MAVRWPSVYNPLSQWHWHHQESTQDRLNEILRAYLDQGSEDRQGSGPRFTKFPGPCPSRFKNSQICLGRTGIGKNWNFGPNRTWTRYNFKLRTGPGLTKSSKPQAGLGPIKIFKLRTGPGPTKFWKSPTNLDRPALKAGGPWIPGPHDPPRDLEKCVWRLQRRAGDRIGRIWSRIRLCFQASSDSQFLSSPFVHYVELVIFLCWFHSSWFRLSFILISASRQPIGC